LEISFLTLRDEAKIGRWFDFYDEDRCGIYVDEEEEDDEVDSLMRRDSGTTSNIVSGGNNVLRSQFQDP